MVNLSISLMKFFWWLNSVLKKTIYLPNFNRYLLFWDMFNFLLLALLYLLQISMFLKFIFWLFFFVSNLAILSIYDLSKVIIEIIRYLKP